MSLIKGKKIGIMTWYYGVNYGALAQSIALYNSVNNLGYDCKLINYKTNGFLRTVCSSNLPKKRQLYRIDRVLLGLSKILKLSTTKYFSVTDKIKNVEEINALDIDCIIFGSDAIFNMNHPLCDEAYYGVGIKKNKITYSPSCEYLDPNTILPERFIVSLNEMKAISVRDVNTYRLILNNTGRTPVLTLDPTFLFDFAEFNTPIIKERYILIYSFDTLNKYKESIVSFAKEKHIKIVSIGQKTQWADLSIENASFDKWVSSFKYAEVVITDSFHGTVFSLKNNKSIVLCGRPDKNAKIHSLLNQFGIKLDSYNGTSVADYLKHNTIDYKSVNLLVAKAIEDSYKYLEDSLEFACKGDN